MNNKGFTLTELLAVIVILSIIILAASISYIGIKDNILDAEEDNLINYVEDAASKYAEETGITTVTVEDLIKEGYLDPDDEENIYNPQDNSSLNCYIITSRIENGNYVAEIGEEIKSGTKCGTYTQTGDYEICEVTVSGDCISIQNSWYKDNITLGVKDKSERILDGAATFSWSGTSGDTSTKSFIITNIKELGQNMYQVKVTKDNVIGEASVQVKIDKQNPTVTNIDVKDANVWISDSTKKVTVEATDYEGSGVVGYYIGDSYDCKNVTYSNIRTKNLGKGIYYVCVRDVVGNISSPSPFIIDKIDTTPGNPTFIASDSESVSYEGIHSSDFILTFNSEYPNNLVEGLDASTIYFEYGTDQNNLNNKGNSVNVLKTNGNITYYVRTCNESGLCSEVANYQVKFN